MARDQLVEPMSDVELINLDETTEGFMPARTDQGVWDSIRSLFVPQEEYYGYQEGVRRGRAFWVHMSSPEDRQRIVRLMDKTNPVDFDMQLEQWRSEGWSPQPATRSEPQPPHGSIATERPGKAAVTATEQRIPETTDTIPVVEEDVRVGKRSMTDMGTVRVRSEGKARLSSSSHADESERKLERFVQRRPSI